MGSGRDQSPINPDGGLVHDGAQMASQEETSLSSWDLDGQPDVRPSGLSLAPTRPSTVSTPRLDQSMGNLFPDLSFLDFPEPPPSLFEQTGTVIQQPSVVSHPDYISPAVVLHMADID